MVDDHPLSLELKSLRSAITQYQNEAHALSVKLQRSSLQNSQETERAQLLKRENDLLRTELETLRNVARELPESQPQQISQLTLSMRALSSKLTLTEEALHARTTELTHATSALDKAAAQANAAFALAAQVRYREEEGKHRELELERRVLAAEEERKMAELAVGEYADLVRSLQSKIQAESGNPDFPLHSSSSNDLCHNQATLLSKLNEGKSCLHKLLADFDKKTDKLCSEISHLQTKLENLQAQYDAETMANQQSNAEAASARFELERYRIDDNAAAKMVSRYMSFSQSQISALQTRIDALKARHTATLATLSAQLANTQKTIDASQRTEEILRGALDTLGADLLREASGRRREVSVRVRMIVREEHLCERVRRWAARVYSLSGERENESGVVQIPKAQFLKVLSEATDILSHLDEDAPGDSIENESPSSILRLLAAQGTIDALNEELESELARRMELVKFVIDADMRLNITKRTDAPLATNDHNGENPRSEGPSFMSGQNTAELLADSDPIERPMLLKARPSDSPLDSTSLGGTPGPEATQLLPRNNQVPKALPLEAIPDRDLRPRLIPPSKCDLQKDQILHPTDSRDDEANTLASSQVSSSMADISLQVKLDQPELNDGVHSPDIHSIALPPAAEDMPPPGTNHRPNDPHRSPMNLPFLPSHSDAEGIAPLDVSVSHTIVSADILERPSQGPGILLRNLPNNEQPCAPSKLEGVSSSVNDRNIWAEAPLSSLTPLDESITIMAHSNHPPADPKEIFEPVSTQLPGSGQGGGNEVEQNQSEVGQPAHPLLAALLSVTRRYDAIQRSFLDCHLALQDLKALAIPPNTSPPHQTSVLAVALERLDDYTEDVRVELEIRIADEAMLIRGYETLLTIPTAIDAACRTPSPLPGRGFDTLDRPMKSSRRKSSAASLSIQENAYLPIVESEIEAFVFGTDPTIIKALQGFEEKLENVRHDIAILKRVAHEEELSGTAASEAVSPFTSPPASSRSTSSWTSWIRGSPSQSPSHTSPPTFGSIMTTPSLRHSASGTMLSHDMQRASLGVGWPGSLPSMGTPDPLAALGLKVPMPVYSFVHSKDTSFTDIEHGHTRSRTMSGVFVLGLGSRSVNGSAISPLRKTSPSFTRGVDTGPKQSVSEGTFISETSLDDDVE